MALGSTQPLTEMSTRCVRLTTLPPSFAVVMKSGNLNFLEPSGSFQACNGPALPLPLSFNKHTVYTAYYFVFSNYCCNARCSAHLSWPSVASCQIITGKQHKSAVLYVPLNYEHWNPRDGHTA